MYVWNGWQYGTAAASIVLLCKMIAKYTCTHFAWFCIASLCWTKLNCSRKKTTPQETIKLLQFVLLKKRIYLSKNSWMKSWIKWQGSIYHQKLVNILRFWKVYQAFFIVFWFNLLILQTTLLQLPVVVFKQSVSL